jgi:hypothetical protein
VAQATTSELRGPVSLLRLCWCLAFATFVAGCGSRSGLIAVGDESGGTGAAGSGGTGAASGSGGTPSKLCPPGGAAVELAQLDRPYAIVVDGDFVYVTQGADNGSVRRIPKAGGAVVDLAQQGSRAFQMAQSATHLYFAASVAGRVNRLGKHGGLEVLAEFQHFPQGVAVRGNDVYWVYSSAAVNGGLRHMNVLDGAVDELLVKLRDPWTLVLHDSSLFYSTHGNVTTVTEYSLTSGAIENEYPTPFEANDLAVTADTVFYTTNPTLFRVHRSSGQTTELLDGTFVDGVATLGRVVYATERGGVGPNGRVLRYDLDSGAHTAIAEGLSAPRRVATDGECVYVTEQGAVNGVGRVLRMAP